MNLKNAQAITDHVIKRIGQFCEIISPAGSIRRQCSEVKDIDVILIPRMHNIVIPDMFGGGKMSTAISPSFITAIKSLGKIEKGKPDGKYMQMTVWNAKVDFFMPAPADYCRILCIRTGPEAYIRNAIGSAWRRLGWCGTDHGLRRIEDCKVIVESTGKRRFELIKHDGDLPPAWISEEHFFEWLQLPYIAPEKRDMINHFQ